MKIKNLPEYERPVEKSIYAGVQTLSNSELLAILLGTGLKEKSAIGLAEDIIAKSEAGIGFLAESSVEELMQIPGIGEKKAARLLASVELGKRLSKESVKPNQVITSSKDIANLFVDDLRFEKQEYIKVLLLNTQGGVITVKTISMGILNSSLIHPREVFREAIKRSACAIVLVHNHPSGDPNPSQFDIDITKTIVEAGELLSIAVLDHIIVGDHGYFSFKDEGLII